MLISNDLFRASDLDIRILDTIPALRILSFSFTNRASGSDALGAERMRRREWNMDKTYHFNSIARGAAAIFILFQAVNCVAALYCAGNFPLGMLILKYCALLFFAACYYSIILRWPEINASAPTKIEVDDFGIVHGDDRILWRDIAEIRHGLPFWRKYPIVSIIPKERNPEKSKRSKVFPLRLPGFAFVYDEIVPYLRERVSDIKTSEDFPDAEEVSGTRARWGVSALICATLVQCGILLYSLERITLGDFLGLQLPAALMLLSGFLGCTLFGDRLTESIGISRLRTIVLGTGALFPSAVFSSYLAIPPGWTFSALALFSIVSLFLGLTTFFLNTNSAAVRRTVIAILALVAVATFAYCEKAPLASTPTPFALKNDIPFLVWSADSRFLAEPSVSEKRKNERFIFNLETRRSARIPCYGKHDRIVWMEGENILRIVKSGENSGDKKNHLLLYNIRMEKELELDSAESITVGRHHPISPDGRRLVWISYTNGKGGKEKIMTLKIADFRNINNGSVETLPLEILGKHLWTQVDWIASDKLFLSGRNRNIPGSEKGSSLLSMSYDLTTGRYELNKTSLKAASCFILPDFGTAFAVDDMEASTKKENANIRYIHLNTGKVVPLAGYTLPSWVSRKGFAFRVVKTAVGKWLSRFDLRNASEKLLTKVPDELILIGVSHNGKRALFVFGGRLSFATYHLYELESNKWRAIEMAGFTGFHENETFSNALVLASPSYSRWAPSSKMAALRNIRLLPLPISCRTRLLDFRQITIP